MNGDTVVCVAEPTWNLGLEPERRPRSIGVRMNLPLSILNGVSRASRPPMPASVGVRAARRLVDSHGRTIRDLRLSITDRCNFRCVYCMDPDVRFMARHELLTVDELVRVARVCVGLGVEKVRITGGEPTLHPELPAIIRGLRSMGDIDLALTTNASRLTDQAAAAWRREGLDRVTISLDAVDPGTFAAMTRSSFRAERVVDGVRAAHRAGLGPVKINSVVVRGHNEREITSLAGLARTLGVEVRFIEFMPLDSSRSWDPARLVPGDEVVQRINDLWPLRPLACVDESATAMRYEFADGSPGGIGVIASVTRPFCGACSRLRITADGKVRPCLFSTVEHDLQALIRSGESDDALAEFLIDATWGKQPGHGISSPGFAPPERPMNAIGG